MTAKKTASKKPASKKPASKKPASKKPVQYEVEIGVTVKSGGPLVPGDVVRLKGDRSVQMTIESIANQRAMCTWSPGSNGYLETRSIALDALVRVS
jgi:uncharacterized protein YodC (DUF2158 family)